MKLIALITAVTTTGVFATGAWSADYQVERSLHLPHSSTDVWHMIGDFCDIDDWHPDVQACALKVIDGKLHRVLTTTGGNEIIEQRIATEAGLSFTYKIASSPMPIENYTATFSIEPRDGAHVSWSARFSSDDPAMEAAIAELFETGLSAIEGALGEE